ncbi:MAG TPA: TonB-dependent receptor, partial [Gemmatimonadaceae bacterium]|nr:TonB-dependent receptor [Gemmatimonadaceae bacterium]
MRFVAQLATLGVALASIADAQLAPRDSIRRDSARTLETVTVSAIRAGETAPVSARVMGAREIAAKAFGQDVPLLLQGTPSLTSYAETGNYWGYSYIRIRGIDQSRINLTLDGIPLNDPEDEVLYFTDFPDLANSLSSVQVQRGVGTSAPGTASYGGSINLQSVPVATTPRNAEVQLQGGSFGTMRASAEYASGILDGRFAMYGRLSGVRSSGYRLHSGTDARSGFFSAAYLGDRDMLKLTATAGLFQDTLAYYGATRAELDTNRRGNILRADETDGFGERLVALSYTRSLDAAASLSITAYRTSATGRYGVCIANCGEPVASANDCGVSTAACLWDFHLDFAWYGATATWTRDAAHMHASAGLNANTYARDHYAFDEPGNGSPLYLNTGRKGDVSGFGKVALEAGRWTPFLDVQLRRAQFHYVPDAAAGITSTSLAWTFVNPKAGVTLALTPHVSAYASYGVNAREPARNDLLGGLDNVDSSSVAFVAPLTRVRPEHAHDLEAGVRLRRERVSLDANVFSMQFRDEILPIGQLSYIGTPLRVNVHSSWRRGVELDATATPTARVELGLTATAMRARIADFVDESTGQEYRDVEPLLTPRFTSSQRARIALAPQLSVSLAGRFSSRAQLDNTG